MLTITKGSLPKPGVLVDSEIQAVMNAGLLQIKDFDADRLEGASYDFRVGPAAAVTTDSKPVDLREQPLILQPYAAALVLVEETVKLSDRILGRLGSHSNLFRHGIFASMGPQIDPGYSGRMRVSLSNPTEHPFLIRHKSAFITAEFVLLTKAPRKKYAGTPGEPDLTEDEINRILSRGGPSLKDLQRDILELQRTMKNTATLAEAMPRFVDSVGSTLARMNGYLQGLAGSRLGAVPLTTLEPGRYELNRDIPAVLQASEDGFMASFFDANIATGGDTEQEALDNLRSLIVDTFEMLESEPTEELGPGPKQQLKVLQSIIRKARQNAD
ncbi:MAG: dCTP deaminase domain-containing protein [Bryobacteraceae bacterium]